MTFDLDFAGHDLNKLLIDGNGKDLFIAIGCSWTRAWAMFDDIAVDFRNPDYRDDVTAFNELSFAGRFCNFLNYPAKIILAMPGSNNDTQTRLLIELLQKNRNKFRNIFVLWGITTHLRWELYSNVVDAPSMFALGSEVPPGKESERKWFLKYHWNNEFEIERLSQKIVTTSSYLKQLNIDHLFFPVFESYNSTNMNLNNIDAMHFFNIDQPVNDMLHLWCQDEGIVINDKILSNPYSADDRKKLESLMELGYLGKNHAHPTVKGHADIARRLINYYIKTRMN